MWKWKFLDRFLESQPNAEIWHALKCTFTGLGLKTFKGDSFWTSPFAQQINTIIFVPLPKITKQNKKKTEIFIYCLTHSAKMFNDIVVSGERGKSSCLQTNMRMLFSAAPRSDIWGKVFADSLWVSRGSRVSCFVLRCEINEKPFDFPSKESVHVGRNCELCRRECRHPLVERGKMGGRAH